MKMWTIDGATYTSEEAHKMLWNWIADNPECSKADFFDTHLVIPSPINFCFACAELLEEPRMFNCEDSPCPIKWMDTNGDSIDGCYSCGSLFRIWNNAPDLSLEEVSILARKIANLEWREEYVRDENI